MTSNSLIHMTKEVEAALAENRPVVALESTILTHGLPRPRNLEVARALEDAVRDEGAVPATIAVMDATVKVGLTEDDLAALDAPGHVAKLSRADLAAAIAAGRRGSTTVAATMIAARAAGIEVFATGGIGGVHRGAVDSWDVSADLQELARTPVTVVCAGPKAILDLPRTLEVLETLGVPVIGYGSSHLPAFWSRTSGLEVSSRMDHPSEIASAHRARAALGIDGGQLVCNPIPEEAEISAITIAPMIEAATAEAEASGIAGKDVTPYLLSRMLELSDGRTLDANVALILNNARLAARIAASLCAMPRT